MSQPVKRIRYVAIDCAFLIALAKGDPACETAVDVVCIRLGFFIVVPPATLQALIDTVESDPEPAMRQFAENAWKALPSWGFLLDGLSSLQEAMADRASALLEEKTNLLNPTSRLVAETSVLGCCMLLSDDGEMSNLDRKCEIVLMDQDLDGFFVSDPASFCEVAEDVFGGLDF